MKNFKAQDKKKKVAYWIYIIFFQNCHDFCNFDQ